MTHLDSFESTLQASVDQRAKDDLRKVLDTIEGRRFVWSLLAAAGVYGRSFTGDALTTAHNEGRREIGIQLLERIEAEVPGSYLLMQREALDEQTMIENGRKAARDQDAAEAE